MHLFFTISIVSCLSSSVLALPVSESDITRQLVSHVRDARGLRRRCGPVSAFYNQTQADWDKYNLDTWLTGWWDQHTTSMASNSMGFAGAFGEWAIGNPDWSCRDDGSSSDCDFDPCDNNVLNDKGDAIRQAYYTMESVNRLHSYFVGLDEAFQVASISAALTKDSWATTFYKDKDVKSVAILKEVLNAVQTVVGIGAAFGGLAGPAAGAAGGAASALFAGGVGAASPLIGQHQDDTFQKSADLGKILGQVVIGAMQSFIGANNALMHGDQYQNTGDIRSYLQDGLFLSFPGIDKNAVIDLMNNFLTGVAINQLYRTQKVFVMGGGACGDNQGIGWGPQDQMVCRDNKAWYLYYWQEVDHLTVDAHKWGWTNLAPGSDQLGQGDWAGVTVQDVINSSLDAYAVARFNYNSSTAAARAEDALEKGWGNPGAVGAAWEGVFTIPVCDVGWAVDGQIDDKRYILQPFGHDYRPHWCGPVCTGDLQTTKDFIAAANMNNFQSPKHMCKHAPGY